MISFLQKLFGEVLSRLAIRVLRRDWNVLRLRLQMLHEAYCSSLKPRIPEVLVRALIAGEDHRFSRHRGVDAIAIVAALSRYLSRGQVSGASTITQQLVRVVTRRYERSIGRKVREILLASLVSRAVPKTDVPGLYLAIAYFGWRMNGLKQACRTLGIILPNMTVREAASLVARIKYPQQNALNADRNRQIQIRTQHIMNLLAQGNSSESASLSGELDATVSDY
jgi:penicillin-binding protein 1A